MPKATSDANCAKDFTAMPTEWYTSASRQKASRLDSIHELEVVESNTTAACDENGETTAQQTCIHTLKRVGAWPRDVP